jgi:hypothetical protein
MYQVYTILWRALLPREVRRAPFAYDLRATSMTHFQREFRGWHLRDIRETHA